MTKFCIEVKKTLSKVYYEVKYFYNHYFKSSNENRINEYNYAPLSEIIIDRQPNSPTAIPVRYCGPPTFIEIHPTIGCDMSLRKRPSHDYVSNNNTTLSPISEETYSTSSSLSDYNNYNTDEDDSDEYSDEQWEILTNKSD